MIDQTMLETAFIVFMIALLGLMFVIIAAGFVAYSIEQDRQAKWLAQRRQKKVSDILSPSSASRRTLHRQVSEALRTGQQEVEDELMPAWDDILNIVDDKETKK